MDRIRRSKRRRLKMIAKEEYVAGKVGDWVGAALFNGTNTLIGEYFLFFWYKFYFLFIF